jgi:hypothetical protein
MILAHHFYNQRITKNFEHEDVYEGCVTDIKPGDDDDAEPFFTIEYDDGDIEDMDECEVDHALLLYTKIKAERERLRRERRKLARNARWRTPKLPALKIKMMLKKKIS